ncbi:glucosamine-6-phosphate deaminase [Bradyrhizobium sp. DASA03005]|uniref:glucosamine-6-phosphate deaminase n=1 Tax=Bradyrhizobium TaxID=374 RepID=UPI001BA933C7|nr:glucosamine-6-phosphate deaminase [Bradyrhizobium liaoningense]MBR1167958.1 glucosamine-6-phosphate deaminase [Bradyrhizobium liaoningense]
MKEYAPRIEIVRSAAAAAAAERGAERIVACMRNRTQLTLGLATGATMTPLYARLVAASRAGLISFREVTCFNLDEYVGLAPSSAGSFHRYMHEHLFGHVDIEAGRARLPNGMAEDVAAEAAAYEAQIAASGGIDLMLLGIGANGHIGFNEPGSDFASRTREVELDEATRVANAGGFPDLAHVPRRAITMGIATILQARSILLVATGSEKAAAVAAAIEGPIGPACPASALRLHRNVEIICDEKATAALAKRPRNETRRTA